MESGNTGKSAIRAIGNGNGIVQLWDTSADHETAAPITADTNGDVYVRRVVFSYGGTILLPLNEQGVLEMWNTSLWADPYRALCSEARALSAGNWARYAPGEPEPAVCR